MLVTCSSWFHFYPIPVKTWLIYRQNLNRTFHPLNMCQQFVVTNCHGHYTTTTKNCTSSRKTFAPIKCVCKSVNNYFSVNNWRKINQIYVCIIFKKEFYELCLSVTLRSKIITCKLDFKVVCFIRLCSPTSESKSFAFESQWELHVLKGVSMQFFLGRIRIDYLSSAIGK